LPHFVANVVLAVRNEVVVAASAGPPPPAAIPVIVSPSAGPVAAVVISAVPPDVARVAFVSASVVVDADNGDAIVLRGISYQIPLATAIDAGESEVVRITGQRLVAFQRYPLGGHTQVSSQPITLGLQAASVHWQQSQAQRSGQVRLSEQGGKG